MQNSFENIGTHNVAELEPGLMGGTTLRRIPKHVRDALTPLGQIVSAESAGCEIRFVTEANNFTISLSCENNGLSPHEVMCPDVLIMKGGFIHKHLKLEPGRVHSIHINDIMETQKNAFAALKPEARRAGGFSSSVWRILMGRGSFTFHGLNTYGYDCRRPEASELPQSQYLSYGSSITNGATPSAYHLSYVQTYARCLKADVYNLGLSGSCHCEKAMADWLAERDDFTAATLELGVNMRVAFTPEEFAERAYYLIDQMIAAHPTKPIYLITCFPNAESPANACESSLPQERQTAFDAAIRAYVTAKSHPELHLIEGADLLLDYSNMTTDLIHPSDYGHSEIGQRLAHAITSTLNT